MSIIDKDEIVVSFCWVLVKGFIRKIINIGIKQVNEVITNKIYVPKLKFVFETLSLTNQIQLNTKYNIINITIKNKIQ
jgi:predicted nucleic acid-binding protein